LLATDSKQIEPTPRRRDALRLKRRLVILATTHQKIAKGVLMNVILAQMFAGFIILAWLIVLILACVFILGLIFYVKFIRRDPPSKKPDLGGFDR
jgi:hypothetical protein